MYLILMTLFSTVAIASDATLYEEDIANNMFGVPVTLFNLIIYVITILPYDFSKYFTINLFFTLIINLTLLVGQGLYYILTWNKTVLTVAGAITLPFTLFKLLYEVKMVFEDGEFRYKQANLLLAAGILWWILFLTLMWISSYSELKRTDTTNFTLSNVTPSVFFTTSTTLD
ncbi:unnamed protein product [Schistosoma rodhaini]|nr:unnamed protein product [Schistosoma rodhaini]